MSAPVDQRPPDAGNQGPTAGTALLSRPAGPDPQQVPVPLGLALALARPGGTAVLHAVVLARFGTTLRGKLALAQTAEDLGVTVHTVRRWLRTPQDRAPLSSSRALQLATAVAPTDDTRTRERLEIEHAEEQLRRLCLGRGRGGMQEQYGDTGFYADALAAALSWAQGSGALAVHAFDSVWTITGQGSTGLELEEQAPALDTVLVAVGGGGLIAGISSWYAGRRRVVGVEPETAPTLFSARKAGEPVDAPAGGVAADSLAPRRVGELVFPIAQRYVADVVLVPDAAILAAQRRLWDVLRIVVEPGAAAPLAALATGAYTPAADERVGLILSGANTTAVGFD